MESDPAADTLAIDRRGAPQGAVNAVQSVRQTLPHREVEVGSGSARGNGGDGQEGEGQEAHRGMDSGGADERGGEAVNESLSRRGREPVRVRRLGSYAGTTEVADRLERRRTVAQKMTRSRATVGAVVQTMKTSSLEKPDQLATTMKEQ